MTNLSTKLTPRINDKKNYHLFLSNEKKKEYSGRMCKHMLSENMGTLKITTKFSEI